MAKKIILGFFLAFFILGTVLGATGSYYFWQQKENEKKKSEEQEEKIKELEVKVKKLEDEKKEVAKKTDQYEGWLTYTNQKIGYELKYPSGWEVEEISRISELSGQEVNYIKVKTPDKKYYLYLALRKNNQNFDLTDRSGVGAGDIKSVGEIKVLNTPIKIKELVLGEKVKEYFYEAEGESVITPAKVDNGKAEILSWFAPGDENLISEINLKNLPEEKIAEKILESLKLL